MRRYAHYTLDENGKQVVTVEEFPDLDAEIAVEVTETTESEPTQLDRIEAQVTYTAMMTDTLMEV